MNLAERVHALIFNGITAASADNEGFDSWLPLPERERFARAVVDELAAGGIQVRFAEEQLAVRQADRIETAAALVTEARQRLADLLTAACPGPHRFVQHRDHRPPWCKACRYTAIGQPVPTAEMGA